MPWYFPWSESIKKRACRYLLQHYLGQFLKEKLTLDQLSVDLYNGTGTIKNVSLDVAAINEVLESSNVPLQLVDGFIGRIEVSVPWSALVSDNTHMQIYNLEVTLQPAERDQATGVMLDSMLSSFSSMTTSMQLAQECLRSEESAAAHTEAAAQPYEGLEVFAQTLEAVLSKVKMSLVDTIVRLEHLPKEAQNGAALEIRMDRVEYYDDLALENAAGEQYEAAAVVHKNLQLMGVSVYCDEFSAKSRTHAPDQPLSETVCANMSPPLSPAYESTVIADQPAKHITEETANATPEPVKIAVLMGTNKIKVKLKQQEDLPGPKMEVDTQVGVVNLHLSPRQVHLLMEIAEGLASPGLCDDSNVTARRGFTGSKPMRQADFTRIEGELQRELQQTRVQHSQLLHGAFRDDASTLTAHALDEEEDIFLSLGSTRSGPASMEGSYSSHTTTRTDTTTGSLLSPLVTYEHGSDAPHVTPPRSTASTRPRKPRESSYREEAVSDVTRYRVKLSFLSLMLLHEDPASTPSNGLDPGVTSQEKLREMAEKYFGRVLGIDIAGAGHDLLKIRADFSQACPYDHLSVLAKPVTVELAEKWYNQLYTLSADVSLGVAELVEALYGKTSVTHEVLSMQYSPDSVPPEYCELLVFEGGGEAPAMQSSAFMATSAPCVRLKLQLTDSKYHSMRAPGNKADVQVELAPCQCELDMTLIDRINSLLNRLPLAATAKHAATRSALDPSVYHSCAQVAFTQAIEEGPSHSKRKTDVKVTAPKCTATVRFPRVDMSQGPGVRPWWKRSLHNELLILEITQLELSTSFWPQQTVEQFEFTCRDGHGLFQVSADEAPVSFVRISTADNPLNQRDEGFDWPRFVVRLYPEARWELEEAGGEEGEESTWQDEERHACSEFSKPHTTPFSQRTTLYDNKEMVLPGDRQEMLDYEEKAASCTRLHLDLSVPNLHAYLPSKPFLELLYNRVLNDMVLWEPLAPRPLEHGNVHMQPFQSALLDLNNLNIHPTQPDSFQQCNVNYDSDSELDESMPYLSVGEQWRRQRKKNRQHSVRQQSRLCFSLNIAHGQLTAYAPLKGEDAAFVQDEAGMFVLFVEDTTVFCEVDHNGDPELLYTCVHSNQAQLYHQGCVSVPSEPPVIQRASQHAPPEVDKTLYLSERGTYTKLSGGQVGHGPDSNDMLSVAVKVHLDMAKNIKECQVAVGVRAATLLHRVTPSGHDWFTQLLELFDLVDYDIPGYRPPKVLTELHAHIWSSSVDYRPLYLPYRALLSVECFTISSNVLADSATSLLRFLIEDAALYISDKTDKTIVDLKKNYVCVADMGMFELALKTSDGTDPKNPTKLELKVCNNILHVRTCPDSMRALSELIIYLASVGDLSDPDSRPLPPTPQPQGGAGETGSPRVSRASEEHVHDMMADAMRESDASDTCDPADPADPPSQTGGGEEAPQHLYFTPPGAALLSDSSSSDVSDTPPSRPPRRRDRPPAPDTVSFSKRDGSPDISLSIDMDDDEPTLGSPVLEEEAAPPPPRRTSDDEFCIIDSPGLGYGARNGVPVVKMLTNKPIQVIDNHFAIPMGRTDVLKAPDNFPPAIYRYTMREVSVVWYMYGGRDFDTSPFSKTSTKTQRALANQRSARTGRLSKLGWQAMGGPGRDIDVLMELQLSKVRMQYETYAETEVQAARQVLLIGDIELRDRLASSKINKFLYHYSSHQLPKQSHTSMVEVKALHVRPDPRLPRQECSLKVSVQPLRLNIDQDALNFMRVFLLEVCEGEEDLGAGAGSTDSADPQEPIMQVQGESEEALCEALLSPLDELREDEEGEFSTQTDEQAVPDAAATAQAQPIFIKCFVFSPDVPIRLDYHGKRVDMGQGTLANLLVGLAQLNCSELRLKRLHYKKGLLGMDRVGRYVRDEWVRDIMKNQIPSILGGVGPMHSLVQIVHGIRDLFWMPVEQYRKDGRLVRGLQRGTHSFMTSTAMSTLELTNRLVQTVQYVAEIGYDMVTPTRAQRVPPRYRLRHPADFREGVVNAYTVISEGVKGTATELVKSAVEGHEDKGLPGAVGGVLKQVPGAILQPVILATGATSNILDGVKNQMQPDRKREDEDKWKPEDS